MTSDFGRKDLHTKIGEGITPDSTKSTQQKVKETFTDTGDKFVRGAQPDSSKSHGQEFSDKVGRSKDREVHGSTGGSILDKAKHIAHLDKH
ncbi:putative chaperone/heat shock protein Hsp12 [Melanomma pulvis-pyrius CBS 109.77]|uniref:Putative chaperone/heat shock protein Hsp12 n=1 Tax=Melanomma pulvis-pyrius CBS 109.77 TaxID=1314802 RepID=A0A6A6XWT1_9PLEO|nr:putative chaperone/heat shock protein Hsp12 [Melanomma pulvis-pyrius CBS 109.77]